MSAQGQQIVCRNCKETISTEAGSCPHCGASIRGDLPYIGAIVLGLIIAVTSVIGALYTYAAIGVVIALGAGYMLYEKRQRIQQASGNA